MTARKKVLLGIGLSFLALLAISVFLVNAYPDREKNLRITIPIESKIERAISVGGLRNEVVYTGEISGSGLFFSIYGKTVGAGMGAPAVQAKDIGQFLYLVPRDERIYAALERPTVSRVLPNGVSQEITDPNVLKKVYWAFIENRAGIVVYNDSYSYYSYETKTWWRVVDYNEQEVVFGAIAWENTGISALLVFLWFVWFSVSLILSLFVVLQQ